MALRSWLMLGLALTPIALASQVLTPYGERPSENVHGLPPGSRVHATGDGIQVLDIENNIDHVARSNQPKIRSSSQDHGKFVRTISDPSAYAEWYDNTSSPIASFVANYTVPPNPTSNAGQTLFVLSAAESASGAPALQAVLQYGLSAAGGGAYWGASTWYSVGGNAYYTPLVEVNSGDLLSSAFTLESSSSSSYTYSAGFDVVGTSLTASGSPGLFYATVTLEAYDLESQSNLPVGAVDFSVSVETLTGDPSVVWTVYNEGTTATVPGADAVLVLDW